MADRQRDVIEILTQDHREVEELFRALEELRGRTSDEDRARRKALVDKATIELVRPRGGRGDPGLPRRQGDLAPSCERSAPTSPRRRASCSRTCARSSARRSSRSSAASLFDRLRDAVSGRGKDG